MRKETIGGAELYNEDCMAVMARYPDKYFALAIVDPPYGGGRIHECRNFKSRLVEDGFGKTRVERTGGAWASKYGKHIHHWDQAPGPEYFTELFRVSKHQIIWGGNYFPLPVSKNFIIWRKKTISENFSMAMAEYAWTDIPGNAKVFEYHPQDPGWFHPTQKPVALYKWLLGKYAEPGDLILDTHLGSGSSAVACNELGFSLVGAEIDADYFTAACKRIEAAHAQGRLYREAL